MFCILLSSRSVGARRAADRNGVGWHPEVTAAAGMLYSVVATYLG